MAVLSESLVNCRIAAALAAGELSQDVADRLSTTHRASDPRRQGQIWFGFSPALPDEHATERLFRYWGGEGFTRRMSAARKSPRCYVVLTPINH
ncbi:MAG: hypothetical protein IPO08_19025 [Xanthomonadales bacterium]|nr:hypothetical protein [Xanthomonadales bacterium]